MTPCAAKWHCSGALYRGGGTTKGGVTFADPALQRFAAGNAKRRVCGSPRRVAAGGAEEERVSVLYFNF